jgi:hypothetical protein
MQDQVTIETMSGQAIDLPQNFTIQLDLINSVFDTEVLRGSFSMPVQIPATPRNRVLFGFPEQPRSTSSVYKIDIRIRYGSMTLIGVLRLKDTTEKAFSSTVIAGVGTVAEALRTTKLTALDLKETIPPPVIDGRPYVKFNAGSIFDYPPSGTVVRLSTWRYDISSSIRQIVYYVEFNGTIADFIESLAAAINDRNPIQVWSPTKSYGTNALAYDTNGDCYEAAAPSVGKTLLPPDYSPTESYVVGDYVEMIGFGTYKCIANTMGVAPPNATYWLLEDYPYWILWAIAANVANTYATAPGTARVQDYDDPDEDYTVEALFTATTITLWDKTYGDPNYLDYLLCLQDTPLLFILDNYREVLPPGFTIPYDLNDYMLDKSQQQFPEVTHTFFPIYNPQAEDGITLLKHTNYYGGAGFATGSGTYKDFPAYLCQPQLYLFFILQKLFEHVDYVADFTAFDEPEYIEYKQLVVYNNKSMEGFLNAFIEYRQRATPITEIDLSQHVPDVTLGEFLNAIRSMLGWQIDFKLAERRVEVRPLRELLNPSQLLDLTDFCEPQAIINDNDTGGFELQFEQDATDKFVAEKVRSLDDLMIADPVQVFEDLPPFPLNPTEARLVIREGAYYHAVLDEPTDTYYWEYHSEALQNFTVDEGGTTLTTKAMPFTMFRGEDQFNASRLWTVPQFDQPLSLTGRGQNRQPFGIRLGFYRGLQRDSNNAVYPLATPDVWTYQGLQVGEKSLRWEGEYGIYEQLYKQWLQFLTSARIVKMQIRYEPYHLNSLNFGQVVRINGTRYVVFRIRVALPINKTAEVEMYRL